MKKTSYLTKYDLTKKLQQRVDDGKMTGDQCWQITVAMMRYDEDVTEPDFSDDAALDIFWLFVKEDLDRARQNYEKTCRQNSLNGAKGGAPAGNSNASKLPEPCFIGFEVTETSESDAKQPESTGNNQKQPESSETTGDSKKQAKSTGNKRSVESGCFFNPKQAKQADDQSVFGLEEETDILTPSVYLSGADAQEDGQVDETPAAADWFYESIKRHAAGHLAEYDEKGLNYGDRMIRLCDSIRQKGSVEIGTDVEKRRLPAGIVLKAINDLFRRPEQIPEIFAVIDLKRPKNRFNYTVTALYNTARYG